MASYFCCFFILWLSKAKVVLIIVLKSLYVLLTEETITDPLLLSLLFLSAYILKAINENNVKRQTLIEEIVFRSIALQNSK